MRNFSRGFPAIHNIMYMYLYGEGDLLHITAKLQLEKAMAPHSSTLAWKIPWTEEPGRLRSMGSLRVGHDWATSLSRTGEGNGNPLQCSCLENPRDGGAWWAAIYGVTQSRIQLKRLSSSSSSKFEISVEITSTNAPARVQTKFSLAAGFNWVMYKLSIINWHPKIYTYKTHC